MLVFQQFIKKVHILDPLETISILIIFKSQGHNELSMWTDRFSNIIIGMN